MKHTKTLKRGIGFVLALAVCFGATLALPMTASAVGIQAGLPTFTVNSTTQTVMFAGEEWYVIGTEGAGVYSQQNHITLLAKNRNFGVMAFRLGGSSDPETGYSQYQGADLYYKDNPSLPNWTMPNEYTGSTLQLKMDAITSEIQTNSAKEYDAISARTLTSSSDGFTGADMSQKLWPLSYDEWGAVNDSTILSYDGNWWLRSPYSSSAYSAWFGNNDGSNRNLIYIVSEDYVARPALSLNLSSVLFTSAASGTSAKSAVAVGDDLSAVTSPSGAVKFTMTDSSTSNLNLTSASANKTIVKAGDTVTVTFGGAVVGTNKYVSCVLVNGIGEVTHYAKLSTAASGTADITIPAAAALPNGDYALRVFNEEANGDNYTDFASASIDISLTVANPPDHTATQTPGTLGEGQDAVFVFNGNYNHMYAIDVQHSSGTTYAFGLTQNGAQIDLSIGGTIVGKAEDSSVKVTLFASWLDTLPAGTYTLTVHFHNDVIQSNGSADFILARTGPTPTPTPTPPAPGDSSTPILWFSLLGLSALALCSALFIRSKKRKQAEK